MFQKGFKTWRCRKNSGRGLILCLRHGFAFSRRLEMYMTSSNAAALRTQNDRCMTSKHRESYREQTAPHAFESLSWYIDVICWSSARCCFKSNTPIHFALWWNYKALTSPHHLLGKVKYLNINRFWGIPIDFLIVLKRIAIVRWIDFFLPPLPIILWCAPSISQVGGFTLVRACVRFITKYTVCSNLCQKVISAWQLWESCL